MGGRLNTERFGAVVIGGGQAGLAVGYYLARSGADFVILDAAARTGDAWRSRWDSLRLFTPPGFNHLPGMRLHPRRDRLHTKDDMADYLAVYAAYFRLPLRLGARVDAVTRHGDGYLIRAGGTCVAASNVVVAAGPYTTPHVPTFASRLDPRIVQLHSSAYRNPAQLRDGAVLVAGAGNSGAEIALEVSRLHPVWLAGRDTGHVPFAFGERAYRAMRKLSVHAWPGRALAAMGSGRGHPLIRVTPADLAKAVVWRAPRVAGVSGGQPLLADGRVLEVENVIWCTGFTADYEWIRLPVFGADGRPKHHRGAVAAATGLYFVGLPFQSSLASHLVGGVGDDARHIAGLITSRARAAGNGGPASGGHPATAVTGHPATVGGHLAPAAVTPGNDPQVTGWPDSVNQN
jgi:putative flavoprotein involved in K+ transport